MNTDEAAQYLGYRDAEHVEMQDLSEYSKWWELIKKLVSKDETELNLHIVSKPLICGNCLIDEDKCECKKPLDFGMVEEYYDEKRKCWATRFVKD